MKPTTSLRYRASRFLSKRYAQREKPSYFADLVLWGLIVIIVTWPMFSLVHTLALIK